MRRSFERQQGPLTSMTTIPDHYAALGIDPTADPEVITAAYRALAKKFHPDTGAAAGTASPERFDADPAGL